MKRPLLKTTGQKNMQPTTYHLSAPRYVRRRHPRDGSPQAGKPYGPTMAVTELADYVTPDGFVERICRYHLPDGTWEFEWNLVKLYYCKFRREAKKASAQKGDEKCEECTPPDRGEQTELMLGPQSSPKLNMLLWSIIGPPRAKRQA
jgi:hypothetical protein